MALVMAYFGTPAMLAAWLVRQTWWRQAGAKVAGMDAPAWLLAAAAATLPTDRRDWGAAMEAELAQVPEQERAAPWRFAVGCAGAACLAATGYYLAEHPSYPQTSGRGIALSLPPVTAVALAVALAGCVWLTLRPPHWLLPHRPGRWFGIGMAVALVAGLVLASRQQLHHGEPGSVGMILYLIGGPILVILPGSAVGAAVGRSFRSGLWACAWAVVLAMPLLIAAWLVEALRWYQQGRGMLLDGDGALGVGVNLAEGSGGA